MTQVRQTGALAVAALILGAVCIHAQEVPFLTGRVVDLADLLSPTDAAALEARLAAFEDDVGSQLVVLTVPSLDGAPIEDYAIRVAEAWKLGREGIDDGVLLLIARDERRMRLEVGYGLEGSLTDARARRILDHVITPRFRAGDFAGGVRDGMDAVMATIRGETPAPEGRQAPPSAPSPLPPLGALLLQLIVFLAIIAFIRRLRRWNRRTWSSRSGWDPQWSRRPTRRGPVIFIPGDGSAPGGGSRPGRRGGTSGGWSGRRGGGFSGGGFSGGGGGFGGGGASGGW